MPNKVYPALVKRAEVRAGMSANQMLNGTPPDPVEAAQPLRPQGMPPPSARELINTLASDPNGPAKYGPHLDSVHKSVQMKQNGGMDRLQYPTVTEIEKRELVEKVRGNSTQVAVKASQNGSIGTGQAIDIMRNNGDLDDSTANAAKAKLPGLAPASPKGQ